VVKATRVATARCATQLPMDAGHILSMNAPQCPARSGDGYLYLESPGGEPLTLGSLKGGLVQMAKHALHGGSARATLSLEAQGRANRLRHNPGTTGSRRIGCVPHTRGRSRPEPAPRPAGVLIPGLAGLRVMVPVRRVTAPLALDSALCVYSCGLVYLSLLSMKRP
jgi:hypothetical protein